MIALEEKRPVGRPRTGAMPIRHIRMTDDMSQAIDKWRMMHLDRPKLTTSDAVRELVIIALLKVGVITKSEANAWLES